MTPLFATGSWRAFELAAADVPRLQAFFDANPEYTRAVEGRAPLPDAAQQEFDDRPPAGFPYTRRWLMGIAGADDALVGVAGVVSDLFASGVWHVGLYIVATALHGRGIAHPLYDALERWMIAGGAHWLRLGVVAGNARAERFWAAAGYREVRVRTGMVMGLNTNTVRVLVKPVGARTLDDYLARVPRDLPGAP